MTEMEALISLNMTGLIGGIRLGRLIEAFGPPQEILETSPAKLMQVEGIGEEIAGRIAAVKKEDLDRELALIKQHNLKVITWQDSDYPENLRNIPDSPPVLYVKGALHKADRIALAIVGSRRGSLYGLNSAEKFAAELVTEGFTIVSGMARGIDTCAHQGALRAGGRTIAVIGSGFADIYPPENKKLAEEIAENGAVISEFPIAMEPLKTNFPRRNRVISGLSLGTLVVEAARNSGALITAGFALEQGREVFALPGKIDAPNSFGANALIKDGAKLVDCAEDILEEFSFVRISSRQPKRRADAVIAHPPELKEESVVYDLISRDPITLDEIVEKSSFAVNKIADLILRLRLKKLIKQLPGEQFIRS
jgi:DNA processing protein